MPYSLIGKVHGASSKVSGVVSVVLINGGSSEISIEVRKIARSNINGDRVAGEIDHSAVAWPFNYKYDQHINLSVFILFNYSSPRRRQSCCDFYLFAEVASREQ